MKKRHYFTHQKLNRNDFDDETALTPWADTQKKKVERYLDWLQFK